MKNRRRRNIRIVLLVFLLLLLILPFLDSLFVRIDRHTVVSEDLPSDIGHLRIVYLSDVHYGFFFSESRINSIVATINSLKPDLVIFGGDMGDSPDAAVSFYQHLPSLHSRYAMLGVLGESDHGTTDSERIMVTDAMRNAGVIPLVNIVTPVRIGSSVIYVAGLDDILAGKPALSSLAQQVSIQDFVVFLSHNPSIIPESHRVTDRSGRLGWYDLALFGHTHGGQFRGLSGLLNIAGDVEDRYLSGWITENRASILISNGVGTSVIPARFLSPPQIHCIDISLP